MEKEKIKHSASHILALAVKRLYPEAKFAIGPAIETGFYYDIDFGDIKITPDDLAKIEAEMKKIIKEKPSFEKYELDADRAREKEKTAGQIYKQELIEDLKKEGETAVSYYKLAELDDLCIGPHLNSAGELDSEAFKLTKLAGAYWRGDENNKMLTRIYGVAFASKNELNEYLKMMEEAEKRDHRKIGKELDLFCFSDLVGAGLPLYTPKGTILKEELQKHIEGVCRKYGFEKVSAPSLAKYELFEISGHAKKFSDELFHVSSENGHKMVLKPVQCPHQTQIYASKTRSYRDLPIRYMESDKQYRAEKTGEVGGLNRVYAITVEDGHSFCRVDQVKDEIKGMVNIVKDFYSAIGLWDNHWVSLSVRDYSNPDKYIGDQKDWDECEKILQEVSDEMDLKAKKCEGEAALYGPKLDFMFRDAIGKEIQIPTVQVDFATPKRFNLNYINQEGKEVPPVMVHRAILGSYERFLALLIEHFAGAFPIWLSPTQVKLISVGEAHIDYCRKLADEFRGHDLRVEVDSTDETVGNKIRKSIGEKIPYVLVVGDKEVNSDNLSIRDRQTGESRNMSKDEFIAKIKKEIKEKK